MAHNVTAVRILLLFLLATTAAPKAREKAAAREEVKLDHRGAQLSVQWKRISCVILIWNVDKPRWNNVEVNGLTEEHPDGPGIATVEEVLATVWPILQAKGCSVDYEI